MGKIWARLEFDGSNVSHNKLGQSPCLPLFLKTPLERNIIPLLPDLAFQLKIMGLRTVVDGIFKVFADAEALLPRDSASLKCSFSRPSCCQFNLISCNLL